MLKTLGILGLIVTQFLPLLAFRFSFSKKIFIYPYLLLVTALLMKLLNPLVSNYTQHYNLIFLFFTIVIFEFMFLCRYYTHIEKYLANYFIPKKMYIAVVFVSIFISFLWMLKINNSIILKFGDINSHLLILNSISQVQQPLLKLGTVDSYSGVINLDGYYYPDLLHYLGAFLIQINILDPIQAFKFLNIFIHALIFPMSIGVIINKKFKNVNSLIYFFLLMSVPFFPLTLLATGNFNSVAGFIISILCAALISELRINLIICFLLSCLVLFFIHPSYIFSLLLFTLIFKIDDLKFVEYRSPIYRNYVRNILILIIAVTIISVRLQDAVGLLRSFIESLPFGQTIFDIQKYDLFYVMIFIYKNFFLFSNYLFLIPFGFFFFVYILVSWYNTSRKNLLILISFVYASSFFSGFGYPFNLVSILSVPFYASPIRILPLFVYTLYFVSFFSIDSRMRQAKMKYGVPLLLFFVFNFIFSNSISFTLN